MQAPLRGIAGSREPHRSDSIRQWLGYQTAFGLFQLEHRRWKR